MNMKKETDQKILKIKSILRTYKEIAADEFDGDTLLYIKKVKSYLDPFDERISRLDANGVQVDVISNGELVDRDYYYYGNLDEETLNNIYILANKYHEE